ncbi:hypothetical protein [Actinomadura sp. SCN-SB]|uniref:hypothetical protein n=1 Tax=Actinomadura sp. SCN-SB TaxID=3373092 RepID=UPI00375107B1
MDGRARHHVPDATGKVIDEVPEATEADAGEAVEVAARAFAPAERAGMLPAARQADAAAG